MSQSEAGKKWIGGVRRGRGEGRGGHAHADYNRAPGAELTLRGFALCKAASFLQEAGSLEWRKGLLTRWEEGTPRTPLGMAGTTRAGESQPKLLGCPSQHQLIENSLVEQQQQRLCH